MNKFIDYLTKKAHQILADDSYPIFTCTVIDVINTEEVLDKISKYILAQAISNLGFGSGDASLFTQ